jgi:hypothetical protein
MAAVARNRFYFSVALAIALLVAFGFMRTFYARPLFDLPPLPTLMQVHGAVFTAWMVLFVVQTRLIAAHKVQTHRQLGIAGVLLATAVFVVGVMTAFESSLATRPRGMGLTSPQFVLVPLTGITFFAVFVALGIAFRKRAALHKRFMVLAMLAVLGPPVARLLNLAGAQDHFLLVQTTVPALFVAWCLIADWRRNHIVHPVFVIGGGLLIVSWPVRAMLARSDGWAVISDWIVRHAA